MVQMNRAQEMPAGTVASPKFRLAKALDWLGNPWGYVLVLPAIILYATFQVWPIVRGVLMAFSPYSWVIPETKGLLVFNGLNNYREIYHNQEWRHSIWVSMKFTAGAWPLNFVAAMFTAVLISKISNPRWSAFLRIVTYLPVVLPLSSAMLLWRNLYAAEYGYINYFLKQYVGWQNPPNWLGAPKWSLVAAVIPTVWRGFGYDTLLFLIGIYSINRELYEAAEIDGANEWQQFWRVTLPLLKPIIVLVLVLGAGLMSATAQIMTLWGLQPWEGGFTGGPHQAALTAGLWAWGVAFHRPDMRLGLAASASLILGVIHMVLSAVIFRTVRVERF